MFSLTRAPLIAITFSLLSTAAYSAPGTLAFTGARIIDGTENPVIENGVLISIDGKISAVGAADNISIPNDAQIIDLAGKTVMPGMINTHGHVGQVLGLESGHYGRGNVLRQLGLYARYGITMINSLGDDEYEGFEIRNDQDPLYINHSRLMVAGPVLAPTTVEQAILAVNGVADQNANFIKIRVDDNLGRTSKMPPEIYQAVADQSEERGIPLAVHMYSLADAKATLAAGADFIAHSVRDEEVDQAFIDDLKSSQVCYTPTLTRELSTFVYESEPDFFSDPFFSKEVDPEIIATLLSPQRQVRVRDSESAQHYKNSALPMAMRNLKKLSDAGVSVVMGTDSGPAARFQGYFEHLEMGMMVEAGMSPMEVIRSATGVAAQCLGLDYLGTLEAGKWTDFVVMDRNPLDDIANTKSLSEVWIAGNLVPTE